MHRPRSVGFARPPTTRFARRIFFFFLALADILDLCPNREPVYRLELIKNKWGRDGLMGSAFDFGSRGLSSGLGWGL